MGIFKAYDVRGLVPSELNAEIAYRIGRAAARHLRARRLAIGRDARTHSPELGEALVRGAREEGATVLDIGLAATPMLYFAVDALGADGGIMLTASHNPGQYNGMKICGPNAVPIGEASGLREIERIAAAVGNASGTVRGGRECKDIVDAYVRHALAVAGAEIAPLRVAIDCAPRTKNGQPPQSTAGVASASSSHGRIRSGTTPASGRPGSMSDITIATSGSASAPVIQNRRRMWRSSASSSSSPALGVAGSSAMPQIGHEPGPSCTISGCIGQVYGRAADAGDGASASCGAPPRKRAGSSRKRARQRGLQKR